MNTILTDEQVKEIRAHSTRSYGGPVCLAPFHSIRFNLSGKATVCCFNREHSLGTYPDNSIREMWFGENAKLLRERVAQNDLGLGCQHCLRQVVSQQYDSLKTKMYDHLPEKNHEFPQLMEFELSNTCNLECVMCSGQNSSSIRKNRDELPPLRIPYDKAFVDQLDEFIPYLKQASFIGGEPFLIDLYYDIWEKVISVNPEIEINVTTNATVLNHRVKSVLERGRFTFSLSLESIQKETLENIRVNANAERLLENVAYFVDYARRKGTSVCVWVCPIKENWQEIPEILNHFTERDVEVYLHTVWFPPKQALWNLPQEELLNMQAFYQQTQLKTDTLAGEHNKRQFNDYVSLIGQWAQRASTNINDKQQLEKLKDAFLESLEKHVFSGGESEKNQKDRWDDYKVKADHWFVSLNDKEGITALETVLSYPIDKVAGEFELWPKEELVIRLNSISV